MTGTTVEADDTDGVAGDTTVVHPGPRRIGRSYVFRQDVREALAAGQDVFLATPVT